MKRESTVTMLLVLFHRQSSSRSAYYIYVPLPYQREPIVTIREQRTFSRRILNIYNI